MLQKLSRCEYNSSNSSIFCRFLVVFAIILISMAAGRAENAFAQNSSVGPLSVQAVKPFTAHAYRATIPAAGALMRVEKEAHSNLLINPAWDETQNSAGSWNAWGSGYTLQPGAGRLGRTAAFLERKAGDGERGISQEVVLNQQKAAPLRFSGWSRAEGVDGIPDSHYSLYADVTFADDTHLWGVASEFQVGTHSWERAKLFINPQKPVKSVIVYALFRNHTGKAWFSDLNLSTLAAPKGTALFDNLIVQPALRPQTPNKNTVSYKTQDGLSLSLRPGSWQVGSLKLDNHELADSQAPSGFLARDVANESGFLGFENGVSSQLKLGLTTQVKSTPNHIAIYGRLSDQTGQDRAVSLAFALPLDATRGWTWGTDIRTEQNIEAGEYSVTAPFPAGGNGQISIYPFASITQNQSAGLALGLDMNYAAQFRIAYNGNTRQFYIIYDFGLAPEKPAAEFRFVLYRTNGQSGFRSAAARFYEIFPGMFQVRKPAKKQGLWMPFTDVQRIEEPADFGIRFREAGSDAVGDGSLKFDDDNDILTFRYTEPMTWWMPMTASTPRDYETALTQLTHIANSPADPGYASAQAVLSSGFRAQDGRYAVTFRDTPWSNGAVWSINPSPGLSGKVTGYSLIWSDDIKKTIYDENPAGKMDGEYLDSLEFSVTADLNYDRSQWKKSTAPLTFATGSKIPAQHKALMIYEFTRSLSGKLHGMNKLVFANSVPYRFSFLTPWLDIMGTEANWLPDGKWQPDADSTMNLRRTLSAGRPYLMLQNTDYDKFTPVYVEKYMQLSLFYGVFPGFFSHDAANNQYWLKPEWYNRDRPLFKKYIPIIQQVAEAGWQPLSLASAADRDIWIERFGGGKTQYLTVRNSSATQREAVIRLESALYKFTSATDLVTGTAFTAKNGVLIVTLSPDQTMALRLS